MSEEELAIARRRPRLAGARLLRERAQATSLEDASVDVALSHMALMLMDDMESVVAELARVLKPGGTLAEARLGREFPGLKRRSRPRTGDVRARLRRTR